MNWQTALAIGSFVISVVSVSFAGIATHQAKKRNYLTRLEALIALRSHYMELARGAAENTEMLKGMSAQKFAQSELEGFNQKLHEVSHEIDGYHDALVYRRA